ncbi:zinc ribbon domain-containing protein [Nocardioides stalactiti]|uniref:zinc ribbon domain-containing protein n=1 Tax=Nocardioides stalactiti TaxID=2755356 RepID=UPI001602E390|nr:zinc ribbon domain-containing protein [Nocardioides stalactiti]
MRYCTNCGHQLGVGRYCTNCGARVPVPPADPPSSPSDFPTSVRIGAISPLSGTVERPKDRPAAPPPPPPDLGPEPTTARYPLFADGADLVEAVDPAVPPPLFEVARQTTDGPDRRAALPWLIAFGALALAALIGGALLLLGDSEGSTAEDPVGETSSTVKAPPGPGSVMVPIGVMVPDTAPPSNDENGERVTYTKGNMLDADPRTAWRMPGDGAGSVLAFKFERPVIVTSVGLINGYAKDDPPHHWYVSNRRIREVVWVFDDGTEVVQELDKSKEVQALEVSPVRTRRIELRLLDVSNPGAGPDSRDFTAISEVVFAGH